MIRVKRFLAAFVVAAVFVSVAMAYAPPPPRPPCDTYFDNVTCYYDQGTDQLVITSRFNCDPVEGGWGCCGVTRTVVVTRILETSTNVPFSEGVFIGAPSCGDQKDTTKTIDNFVRKYGPGRYTFYLRFTDDCTLKVYANVTWIGDVP